MKHNGEIIGIGQPIFRPIEIRIVSTDWDEMGRRKSKRKPPSKKKAIQPLDTQFNCPFCNHEKSCDVKMYVDNSRICVEITTQMLHFNNTRLSFLDISVIIIMYKIIKVDLAPRENQVYFVNLIT